MINLTGCFFPPKARSHGLAEDAIIGKETLKMHGFLDQQTTTATTYIVTRNLDDDALFYSLVKVIFSFRVSGQTSIGFEAVFSPMIQYNYGLDGYARLNDSLYVWELVLLIFLSLFLCGKSIGLCF